MQDYIQLFKEQIKIWPLAENNYKALQNVISKELLIDGVRIVLQCNPARIVSSTANINKGAIQARPCFLCEKNRPSEQNGLPFHTNELTKDTEKADQDHISEAEFQILVNPFPVFPIHYTIAASKHQPQTIRGNFETLLKLAKKLDDCVVFYNGPRCGASAPDHLHFQAGNKGLLPVDSGFCDLEKNNLLQIFESENFGIYKTKNFLRNAWLIKGKRSIGAVAETRTVADVGTGTGTIAGVGTETGVGTEIRTGISLGFETIFRILEVENNCSNEEPMINLLCWFENKNWYCLIFPRKAHRPDCYYREGEAKFLISPASVEMGGLIVASRMEDFERIKAENIREIYNDVSISDMDFERLSGLISKTLENM